MRVFLTSAAVLLAGTAFAHAQEFDANHGLSMIGADAAIESGITGKGVRIGVIDSGIFLHDELSGRVHAGIDFTVSGDSLTDSDGHGTHVAGIIGAAADGVGMQGVAPGVELYSYKLLGSPAPGLPAVSPFASILAHAAQHDIHVFNASIGAPLLDLLSFEDQADALEEDIEALVAAGASDIVFVFATGNEGKDTASILANIPSFDEALQSSWLAVTAVGPSGIIASYANACGSAAQWCLAAPGGDGDGSPTSPDSILSTATGGGYVAYDGTSMATPHVSGALALGKEAFSGATYEQLAALTLQTATDIGEEGVDDVYGWGLLNVSNLMAAASSDHLGIRVLEGWAQSLAVQGVADAIRGERSNLPTRLDATAYPQGNGQSEAWGRAWIAPLAMTGVIDAGPNTGKGETSTAGAVAGLDLLSTQSTTAGVFGGFTSSNLTSGRDESSSTGLHGGAYAALEAATVFGNLQVGYSAFDARTTRRTIPGMAGTVMGNGGTALTATYPDTALWASGRFGARFDVGPLELSPYLKGDAIRQSFGDGSEAGASILAASVDEGSASIFSTGPGIHVEFRAPAIGAFVLTPSLDIAYVRHFGDVTPTRSGRVLGTGMAASGPSLGADAVELGAGLKIESTRSPFEVSFDYSGTLRANAQSHAVSAGVSLKF